MNLQIISDNTGKKIAVILPIDEYERICEKLEELESIKAYDSAKSSNDKIIPFEQAVKEIENSRK